LGLRSAMGWIKTLISFQFDDGLNRLWVVGDFFFFFFIGGWGWGLGTGEGGCDFPKPHITIFFFFFN
jgi:hypothetical protein